MRSDLPIAGFALIEASDTEAAIAAVAQTPCAVAYGVVEIWPARPYAMTVCAYLKTDALWDAFTMQRRIANGGSAIYS